MAKSYLDKDGLLYFLQKIRPSSTPLMDGTASTGTSKRFAAEDHVHPTDTTLAPKASPALTGTPTAPTAATGTATTQIATTEFVSNTVGAMTSGVSDVRVDSTSVVTSGVATITNQKLGFVVGACTTSADTAAKVVALSASANFSLHYGGIVGVVFENGLKTLSSAVTLNVGSTGAIPIGYAGQSIASVFGANYDVVTAEAMAFFQYSVDYWELITSVPYTANDWQKLNGIAANAEVNVQSDWNVTSTSSDAFIKNKPTIVNTRGTATSGGTTLSVVNTGDMYNWNNKIDSSAKGAASGVCPLNASSKIDSTYLPSYVDDVIEAYARSGATALSSTWLSTTSGGSALTPETGKIYVLMADSGSYTANSQFRWGGSAYVKLNDGGVSAITNAEIDTIVAS